MLIGEKWDFKKISISILGGLRAPFLCPILKEWGRLSLQVAQFRPFGVFSARIFILKKIAFNGLNPVLI